jgi:hypothetical protein
MEFDKSLSEEKLIELVKKGAIKYNDVAVMMSLELPLLHFSIYKNYFHLFELVASEKTLSHLDKIKRSAFEFALLLNSQNCIQYVLNNFDVKKFVFFPLWCIKSNQLALLTHYHDKFDLTRNYNQRSLLEHLCFRRSSYFDKEIYFFLKDKSVEFNLQKEGNSFFQFFIQRPYYDLKSYMGAILTMIEFNPEQVKNVNYNNENTLHIYFKYLESGKSASISQFDFELVELILKSSPELVIGLNNKNQRPRELLKNKNDYTHSIQKLLKETEQIFVEKKQLEDLLFNKNLDIEKKERMKKL